MQYINLEWDQIYLTVRAGHGHNFLKQFFLKFKNFKEITLPDGILIRSTSTNLNYLANDINSHTFSPCNPNFIIISLLNKLKLNLQLECNSYATTYDS